MQMRWKHELLVAVYEAFRIRKIDSVLATVRSDVEWPNRPGGRRIFGRENVPGYSERQRKMIDPHTKTAGDKLRGKWTLISGRARSQGRRPGPEHSWLLRGSDSKPWNS